MPPSNFQDTDLLPSPDMLKKKVLVMANVNSKLLKGNHGSDDSVNFFKIVSLFQSKVDLERKGQFTWNICSVEESKVLKL